jgi:hypothetical protein
MDFLKDEGGAVNVNKTTSILAIAAIVAGLGGPVAGLFPAVYSPFIIAFFAALSEFVNALKGGLSAGQSSDESTENVDVNNEGAV